jgi:hypothetical protein
MAKLSKIASDFFSIAFINLKRENELRIVLNIFVCCIIVILLCSLAGFEPVKKLFERNFAEKREQGAQVCAYYKGKKEPAVFFFFFLATSKLPWLYRSDLPWL